jgi:hypothetical protein
MHEEFEQEPDVVGRHVDLLSCYLEIQNKTTRKERVKLPASGV